MSDKSAARELASYEHEFSTERIYLIDEDVYYVHDNGGRKGAHNRQD